MQIEVFNAHISAKHLKCTLWAVSQLFFLLELGLLNMLSGTNQQPSSVRNRLFSLCSKPFRHAVLPEEALHTPLLCPLHLKNELLLLLSVRISILFTSASLTQHEDFCICRHFLVPGLLRVIEQYLASLYRQKMKYWDNAYRITSSGVMCCSALAYLVSLKTESEDCGVPWAARLQRNCFQRRLAGKHHI